MADRIEIVGIKGYGYHGVYPEEHATGQPFEVDITVWTDFREAARTDDLSHTISYVDLATIATEIIEGPRVDLIETLASRIADQVQSLPQVQATEVTVHKPEAPIGVEFRDVSVVARRSHKTAHKVAQQKPLAYRWRVVLSLGANIGDSRETISQAVTNLSHRADMRLCQRSSLYATAPWGMKEQEDFLNLSLILETNLDPVDLLHILQEEELRAHRQRTQKWGPRTLDVDIIALYDASTGREYGGEWGTELILPHPYATERAFVLIPWQEIEPNAHLGGVSLSQWIEKISEEERAGVIPLAADNE